MEKNREKIEWLDVRKVKPYDVLEWRAPSIGTTQDCVVHVRKGDSGEILTARDRMVQKDDLTWDWERFPDRPSKCKFIDGERCEVMEFCHLFKPWAVEDRWYDASDVAPCDFPELWRKSEPNSTVEYFTEFVLTIDKSQQLRFPSLVSAMARNGGRWEWLGDFSSREGAMWRPIFTPQFQELMEEFKK